MYMTCGTLYERRMGRRATNFCFRCKNISLEICNDDFLIRKRYDFFNMIAIKTDFNPFSAGIDFRCLQNLQNPTSMDTKELTNKTFMMISNRRKLLLAMITGPHHGAVYCRCDYSTTSSCWEECVFENMNIIIILLTIEVLVASAALFSLVSEHWIGKIGKYCHLNCTDISNFYPLGVVHRGGETQRQVGKNKII